MENYFWNTEEHYEKKIYILIIYDIVDNKRRNALAKKLSGYGFRVQKSAFESLISEQLYKKLLDEIPRMINPEQDSVRIYKFRGYGEVKLVGVNDSIENEEVIII